MGSVSFSTLVEADEQVVVDRTMTWDDSGYGSHAERGTLTRTATTWYLAEGATHGNFSLFYLIQNAGTSTAEVDVTFLLPAGQAPVVKHYSIPGDTRFNVNVDDIPELAEAEMSAVITSTNGVPIVVERAMYLNTPQQAVRGGPRQRGCDGAGHALVPRGRRDRSVLRHVHPDRQPDQSERRPWKRSIS